MYAAKSPVIFIVFNRPAETARVFAEIAKARPPKLLLIADGPRTGRVGEAERVAEVRKIATSINWPCELLTNFSEVNLGCRRRVSTGLDWAFSQVEEAIVLEDDCLPDPTFFRFCDEMLERYRHDMRIGMIAGSNFAFGHKRAESSYFYSRHVLIWGWATWSDRWRGNYDVNMRDWPQMKAEGRLFELLHHADEARLWTRIFDANAAGKVDTWDMQWVFANWKRARLSIIPNVNLVSNIGFGVEATHTFDENKVSAVPASSLQFPLRSPEEMIQDVVADRLIFRNFYYRSLFTRIYDRLSMYRRILISKINID